MPGLIASAEVLWQVDGLAMPVHAGATRFPQSAEGVSGEVELRRVRRSRKTLTGSAPESSKTTNFAESWKRPRP